MYLSPPEVFLNKAVLKICSKFTVQHPCRSAISIKLLSNVTEITLRHGRSPVILLHIFRTTYPKKTSGGLNLPKKKISFNPTISFDPNTSRATKLFKEAVTLRHSVKTMFIGISQNSQKNSCARVSFLIELQADVAGWDFGTGVFLCFTVNFAKFLRSPFITEHIRRLLLF